MCGVFGVFGHPEAANLTYLGLHALQHRGQESAGIVASDGDSLRLHRGMGHVAELFDVEALSRLPGDRAVGHVRYSTTGSSALTNAQPFVVKYALGAVGVAHNGNLTNAQEIHDDLERQGSIFQSTSDTEVIVHLLAREREGDLPTRIARALSRVRGAYSLLFISEDQIVGARDPLGFRPLVIGKLSRGSEGSAWVLASETCALDLIEAAFVREVEPGEIVVVDKDGLRSVKAEPARRAGKCVFELVYFARPDSTVFGRSVYEVRRELGRQLFREKPAPADLVIPVPDSGVPAAIGYAEAAGLPFDMGLIRSHYVGRTFIEPEQRIRHFGVKLKLNPVERIVRGKRLCVVDDSIVRGTTSRKIVSMLRAAGAREVHLRISAPPTAWPCYYGIDTPNRGELIAANHTLDEIARFITADSLGYLSVEGMHRAAWGKHSGAEAGACDACFSGEYLVPLRAPVA
jgi:amidophosphoribosyltransferase